MKKFVRVFVVFILLVALVAGALTLIGYFRKKGAGIKIETIPNSTVFIDGVEVGKTPYQAIRDSSEVTIKLIPDSFEKPLAPFETKITLVANVQTTIKREFGETEDLSSGSIVSFEKTGGKKAGVSVISIPDGANLSLDQDLKGSTPFKIDDNSLGSHHLVVSAAGFKEEKFDIEPVSGYKLTVIAKLLPTEEVLGQTTIVPTPTEEPKLTQFIEILNTGTGFLRVRLQASTLSDEVGRVEPGKTYPLVEKDEKTGWFKIEYLKGKQGWVTNQFAKLAEKSSTPSPTPTTSPKATTKTLSTPRP